MQWGGKSDVWYQDRTDRGQVRPTMNGDADNHGILLGGGWPRTFFRMAPQRQLKIAMGTSGSGSGIGINPIVTSASDWD